MEHPKPGSLKAFRFSPVEPMDCSNQVPMAEGPSDDLLRYARAETCFHAGHVTSAWPVSSLLYINPVKLAPSNNVLHERQATLEPLIKIAM